MATYEAVYQALAELCQWFVTEMGVPDVWLDFTCCAFGAETECRRTRAEVDRFSGFLGHCHFGRGIDTHADPGHLDVERVRSFMQPLEGDPMAGFYIVEDQVDDRGVPPVSRTPRQWAMSRPEGNRIGTGTATTTYEKEVQR
jgi:hypothetical protein